LWLVDMVVDGGVLLVLLGQPVVVMWVNFDL
jgi:hypothetical protein